MDDRSNQLKTLRLTLTIGCQKVSDGTPTFVPEDTMSVDITAPCLILHGPIGRKEVEGYAGDLHRKLMG